VINFTNAFYQLSALIDLYLLSEVDPLVGIQPRSNSLFKVANDDVWSRPLGKQRPVGCWPDDLLSEFIRQCALSDELCAR